MATYALLQPAQTDSPPNDLNVVGAMVYVGEGVVGLGVGIGVGRDVGGLIGFFVGLGIGGCGNKSGVGNNVGLIESVGNNDGAGNWSTLVKFPRGYDLQQDEQDEQ